MYGAKYKTIKHSAEGMYLQLEAIFVPKAVIDLTNDQPTLLTEQSAVANERATARMTWVVIWACHASTHWTAYYLGCALDWSFEQVVPLW